MQRSAPIQPTGSDSGLDRCCRGSLLGRNQRRQPRGETNRPMPAQGIDWRWCLEAAVDRRAPLKKSAGKHAALMLQWAIIRRRRKARQIAAPMFTLNAAAGVHATGDQSSAWSAVAGAK